MKINRAVSKLRQLSVFIAVALMAGPLAASDVFKDIENRRSEVSAEVRSVSTFCEDTITSYARSFREGYREPVLIDLVNEPSFRSMDSGLQKAFLQMILSSASLPPGEEAEVCKEIVNSTLSKISVEQIENCKIWGRSAEIILSAVRNDQVDDIGSVVASMESESSGMGVVYQSILEKAKMVAPSVPVKEFGAAYYRSCLGLTIVEGDKDNDK